MTDLREQWRTKLMERHSNQLSMQEISNLATDIEADNAAQVAAALREAYAYCINRSNKLGEYRKVYAPNEVTEIERLKFAQTQLDLLSDEISGLTPSPSALDQRIAQERHAEAQLICESWYTLSGAQFKKWLAGRIANLQAAVGK